MTQEQMNYLDFTVNIQFQVLRLVKKELYDDEWTDGFNKIVQETKNKLIWDLENFFLLAEYSFNPLTRNFIKGSEPLRLEIVSQVNTCFQNFIKE